MNVRRIRCVLAVLCAAPIALATPAPTPVPTPAPETPQTADAKGEGRHVLLRFERPEVTGAYAVVGEARITGDGATAAIETMNYFEGNGFFSKDVDALGRPAARSAAGEWKPFRLPFMPGEGQQPELVELVVEVTGPGVVEVRDVRLTDRGAATAGAWWSNTGGGWAGGIGGSFLGVMGLVVGFLAWRRWPRRLVFATVVVVMAVSGLALIAGVVAVVSGQPYAVYYPLLLIGLIGTIVPGANWFALRKRYAADELRRVSAMDAA